jgi:hypothetical protein
VTFRFDLHPKHRASWHVPTAELAQFRLARRRRWAGGAIVVLLLAWLFLADPLGLDQVAAFALLAGIIMFLLAAVGRARGVRGTALLLGVLFVAAGISRELLLRSGRAACQRAYRTAATGAARAAVLGLTPYDGLRRWMIQGRRLARCGELMGGSPGP